MRYFIHLAYNGANYFGWQLQPDAASVQETIEKCLSLLLRQPRIALTGCGRTDTQVNASCFYAHFDIEDSLSPNHLQQLTDKLNSFLPKDIVIYRIFMVNDDAHARFDATSRTYKYFISLRKDPFNFSQRMFSYRKLDVDTMNKAAALLLVNEDFTSFSKVHTQVNNFICHISYAQWGRQGDDLVFTITANRFLRNMVRAIVGTLIEVGLGRITPDDFQNIINQKDRCKARMSAPACALFLADVQYPWEKMMKTE